MHGAQVQSHMAEQRAHSWWRLLGWAQSGSARSSQERRSSFGIGSVTWRATKELLSSRLGEGWRGYWRRLRSGQHKDSIRVPDSGEVREYVTR